MTAGEQRGQPKPTGIGLMLWPGSSALTLVLAAGKAPAGAAGQKLLVNLLTGLACDRVL